MFLGRAFGFVVFEITGEKGVKLLLGLPFEENHFAGKQPVLDGILRGALFAFLGARAADVGSLTFVDG